VSQHEQSMKQAAVEHEALRHIIGGLRTVLDWKPTTDDLARKLSSLRFIAQSFQRHLERLMALKEQDGYMTDAVEQMPALAEKVQALLRDHDEFEETLHRLVLRLEHLSPSDKPKFDAVCRDMEELLVKLEDHHRREADLMQEAFQRDVGGQG
jgi:hemerythrin-like domain-containing protein